LLWSALFYDRARLVVELAKAGTTPAYLVRDYMDMDEQRGGGHQLWGEERLLLQALVYFGDQGNPQPTNRRVWADLGLRTPDWIGGRLSPLEAEPPPADASSLADQVIALLERRQQQPTQTHEKPGVKETPVSGKLRRQLALLRVNGESVAEIMRQTKLTKTIATRLVRDVDDALGKIRAGRY
jgi:hypothetical protein